MCIDVPDVVMKYLLGENIFRERTINIAAN